MVEGFLQPPYVPPLQPEGHPWWSKETVGLGSLAPYKVQGLQESLSNLGGGVGLS